MAAIADPTASTDDEDARRQALLDRLAAFKTDQAQGQGDNPTAGDNPNSADNPGPSDTKAATDDGPSSLGTGAAPDKFSAVQNVLADRTGVSPAADQPLRTRPVNDDTDRLPVAGPAIPTQQQDAPPSGAQLGTTARQAFDMLPAAQSPAPTPTNGFAPQPLGFGTSPFAPKPLGFTAPPRPVNDVAPSDGFAPQPLGFGPSPLAPQPLPFSAPSSAPSSTPSGGFAPQPMGFGTSPLAPQPLNFTPPQSAPVNDVPPGPSATAPSTSPVNDVAPGPAPAAQTTPTPTTPTVPVAPSTPTQSDVIKTILGGTGPTPPAAPPTPTIAPAPPSPSATGAVAPIVETAPPTRGTATVPAAPVSTGVADQTQGALSGIGAASSAIQSLQQQLASAGNQPEVAALFTQQLQGLLAMINQQEETLRANAERQGSTIDTATQTALDQLKKSLDHSLQATREDLNRRGLYQSGILLDLEQKLRSGNMSDQAQLLGKRLDEIQKNLQASLMGLQTQRFTTAREFALKGAESAFTADQNAQNRRERLITEMAKLQAEQERQARQFDFQQAEQARLFAHEDHSAAQERAFKAQQQQAQDAFLAEQERQKAAAAVALEQQKINAGAYRAPSTGMTDYQRAELALRQQELQQSQRVASGQTIRTDPVTGEQNPADVIRSAQVRIQQNFETREDAVANVQQLAQNIIDKVGEAGYKKILDFAADLPSKAGPY